MTLVQDDNKQIGAHKVLITSLSHISSGKMVGVKEMTGPAAKLTCDEGCTNTFTSRKTLENHMKKKHDNVVAGGSNKATDIPSQQAADNVDVIQSSQNDEEASQEAKEDQELADHLEQIEKGLKDDEQRNELVEKIQRLGVIIKNKNAITKDMKEKHEHEISNRTQVEESQLKDLEKLQSLKDRNVSILRESKKKKRETKELEKDKKNMSNELAILRVKNGMLVKENSTLKIDNQNKAKYIKQLEESNAPSNDSDDDETEEAETVSVLMDKDSQSHNCNACDKSFLVSRDLENHMEAKHSQKSCTFCDKAFNSDPQLIKHYNHCIEYGNTVMKCKKCKNNFTRFGIKRHGETCTGKQNNVYSCSVCSKKGESISEVKKHQAEVHTEVVEVSREVCKHWRKGHCLKGDMCLFSHVGHQQKTNSNSTTRTSTANWTPACHHGEGCSWLSKGNCRYFHKGVGVQKPTANKPAQPVERPIQHLGRQNIPRTKMCHFDAKCTNTMCRFKHSSNVGFSSQRGQNRPQMRVLINGQSSQ